jgi:hypothetical protein
MLLLWHHVSMGYCAVGIAALLRRSDHFPFRCKLI